MIRQALYLKRCLITLLPLNDNKCEMKLQELLTQHLKHAAVLSVCISDLKKTNLLFWHFALNSCVLDDQHLCEQPSTNHGGPPTWGPLLET